MIRFALLGALALFPSAAQAQACKATVNERQLELLRCAGAEARQLASRYHSTDKEIAGAAVVRCQMHRDRIIAALVSDCGYPRDASQAATDRFMAEAREDVMQALRTMRPPAARKAPGRDL